MKKAVLPLWLATLALSPHVSAQTPSPAPAPSTPGAAPGEPALPNVEDPMLAPPPPPVHVVTSWREALSLLRARSTQLRSQLAQVDVARARSREALANALPQLGTALGSTFVREELLTHDVTGPVLEPGNPPVPVTATTTLPSPNPALGAGLLLRIPAFYPKVWYDKSTADDNITTQKLTTKEVEREVIASVADTIVTTVTAEHLAESTRVQLKSALSTLDLTRRRSSLGASSALDVLRAEGDVQTARAQVVAADETMLEAREALGLALGSPEGWGVTEDIHLDALTADARASCHAETDVRQRSDVRAAAAALHVAERGPGSVDWAFWPTLDAVSQLTYANGTLSNGEHVSWTIGLSLNWTLYDGGLRYGQKDEAKALARVAQESLTDTQRRAELQVTQALRAVTVAETNLTVSAKARDIAVETARLARVAFVNGSGTSFDLVQTAGTARQAELDLIVKQFQVLRARVAALLALSDCDV
ncbi:MAG TPA: TolC family protein [Polyangiaceae bacterium]|nr:TolC family protein [Polyangiaceae bacterium]